MYISGVCRYFVHPMSVILSYYFNADFIDTSEQYAT